MKKDKTTDRRIGKFILGKPRPNSEYRPIPRRREQTPWLEILREIPVGEHRELKKEDGSDVNAVTVMVMLRRYEKLGLVKKGEYGYHAQKRPDGSEATLLFHYGPQSTEPPSRPVIRTEGSAADADARLDRLLTLLEANSKRLSSISSAVDELLSRIGSIPEAAQNSGSKGPASS